MENTVVQQIRKRITRSKFGEIFCHLSLNMMLSTSPNCSLNLKKKD